MHLSHSTLAEWQKKFYANSSNTLAMNAVTRLELQELAVNRKVIENIDFCFSHEVETAPEATSQKKVGICWMYASFNWCRETVQRQLNIESFEFSGSYLIFWDKLEKINYFLTKIIDFIDQPNDERVLWMLLRNPHSDEGWWHSFANLVKKYGLIPKSVMNETKYTEDSTHINSVISYKLRDCAAILRKMHRKGCSINNLQEKRLEFMEEMYRTLSICLGTPPERFSWSYRDKDKKFHRLDNITPQDFYKQCVGLDLDNFYTVWNSPTSDMSYFEPYTIAHTENMVGGKPILSINLPIERLKNYVVQMIENNDVCFFNCDVKQDSLRKEGFLYEGVFNYDLIFQASFNGMDKATRLEYGEGRVSHSMVFTGVDLVADKPIKWKVENSWGKDVGKDGYFVMSDSWFSEYVYEILVPKKYLEPEILAIFENPPKILPFWHPML